MRLVLIVKKYVTVSRLYLEWSVTPETKCDFSSGICIVSPLLSRKNLIVMLINKYANLTPFLKQ